MIAMMMTMMMMTLMKMTKMTTIAIVVTVIVVVIGMIFLTNEGDPGRQSISSWSTLRLKIARPLFGKIV